MSSRLKIGDLVRIWGWGEILVITNTYFDRNNKRCFDAYGFESRQLNKWLYLEQEEVTVVSRAK